MDGGAIALGHPIGASGARVVLHALKVLERTGGRRAVASLCIGGGQGGAMLLENLTSFPEGGNPGHVPRFLSRYLVSAGGLRTFMNLWPPFRGMGIRVREIAPDFRKVIVELRMKLFNRNYVGTHFGGSLFAMTDPYWMIMMMRNLGDEYVVWDKAGTIRFLKPAKGRSRRASSCPRRASRRRVTRRQAGKSTSRLSSWRSSTARASL